jgi:RNA polymerase sigma factor (sigma-70 family)
MITKDLLDSITSRAEVLCRRYYFLEKDDLFQDGYILLMELENKDLSELQKHKAINNRFSNLERNAQYRQKIERNTSSFEIYPDIPYNMEEADMVMEREEITSLLLDKLSHQEIVVVEWLSGGWTLDKIAQTLGVSRDRTRRIVNRIIDLRKEINNAM